jgi:alpha-tubulin suppressor-like RCC1 family protein
MKVYISGSFASHQYKSYSLIRSDELRRVKHVACGTSHIVIITENNEIYTAGDNVFGQLGMNQITDYQYELKQLQELPFSGGSSIDLLTCGPMTTALVVNKNQIWICGKDQPCLSGYGVSSLGNPSFRQVPMEAKSVDIMCLSYHHSMIVISMLSII